MTDTDRKPIKRHSVSDLDGTQQGGLACIIAVFAGMIAAATLAPGALTSFWVWCILLALSISIGLGVQRLFAREEQEGTE
ncbi:hypothetical protein [uncultured Tateyamaria sp.]|uniref:hypothetical protein n=1 Tax=uncultured Tateyamaria sp. TaxID=455651 RepID=UPI00261FE2E9|nr:hypothetical protein [uncultured Tateyamaria sp.]